MKVTSTSQNGNVQATGCERKGDVTIDMNADNAAGFMSGINWTTDVVQDIVVPIVQESGSGSGSGQALTLTAAPDRGEWETCTDSTQCKNQCCSSKYSDGVLKCTPVGGFKPSEGCVGSATRRLRGNNEAEVLTADETNTNFMHYAAPVEELGRDVEYGDELN